MNKESNNEAKRKAENEMWYAALRKLPEAAGRLYREKSLLSGEGETE